MGSRLLIVSPGLIKDQFIYSLASYIRLVGATIVSICPVTNVKSLQQNTKESERKLKTILNAGGQSILLLKIVNPRKFLAVQKTN
jgi:hypothetical protein